MARLLRNLAGLCVLAVAAMAAANLLTTGHVNPCDAAADLHFRAYLPARPRPDGIGAWATCQREVLHHQYEQITGRVEHHQ